MKNYLFVNAMGKKFKTTQTGKAQILKHPKLSKTCKLLGECTEKGQLLTDITAPITNQVSESLKEIMMKKPVEEVIIAEPVIEREVKFKEPFIETRLKRKYNVKEKKR